MPTNKNNGGIQIKFYLKNPEVIKNVEKIINARDTTAGKFAKQIFMEKIAELADN